jgi:malonyl-CoA/methylmalonyl-CoA synthetase
MAMASESLPLLAPVMAGGDTVAVSFPQGALSYTELRCAASRVAADIKGARRVAVWAESRTETAVAVVGALMAGVPCVPVNPKAGDRELEHELSDSAPDLMLCAPDAQLPPRAAQLVRRDVDVNAGGDEQISSLDGAPPHAPALILYTSGTTGPPKGVVLPRRAIASNLDGIRESWQWTADDVLVHSLPLFHAHGLVLGLLGPLRVGGALVHIGRFSSVKIAAEIDAGATMVFGVPTMYHRLAQDAAADKSVATTLGQARLLISGSAPLSRIDMASLAETTGKHVLERYGMSETLFLCACRADAPATPGSVGPPVPSVSLRRVDEDGVPLGETDRDKPGEIQVRGPNLFLEYLNQPEVTRGSFVDGWFRTGDIATQAADGSIVLMGRSSTDIIKSGGYKIGAHEIESVLLENEHVAEVAVTGEPDDDLGQRVVAWVVPNGDPPAAQVLIDHVANNLSPHKRPRSVHYLASLPRNHMGKVLKRELSVSEARD